MIGIVKGGNNNNGLKSIDKQALINIVNEAENVENTLKNDLATLLKNKDGSLSIPTAPSWEQLKGAISNIYIGKRWAIGDLPLLTTSNLTGSITGLIFKPSFVLFFYGSGSTNATNSFSCISPLDNSEKSTSGISTGVCYVVVPTPFSSNILNDGFNFMRVSNGTSGEYRNGKWIAFE